MTLLRMLLKPQRSPHKVNIDRTKTRMHVVSNIVIQVYNKDTDESALTTGKNWMIVANTHITTVNL